MIYIYTYKSIIRQTHNSYLSFDQGYITHTESRFLLSEDYSTKYFGIRELLYTNILVGFNLNLGTVVGFYGFAVPFDDGASFWVIFTIYFCDSSSDFV